MRKAPKRTPMKVSVLTNKGRGFAVNVAGDYKGSTVYLPAELGLQRGDRVYLYPIEFEGMAGIFVSKTLKE